MELLFQWGRCVVTRHVGQRSFQIVTRAVEVLCKPKRGVWTLVVSVEEVTRGS